MAIPKKPIQRKEKICCPVGFLLSLLLVIGVFAGIAVLVIPELVGAVSIVISSVIDGQIGWLLLKTPNLFAVSLCGSTAKVGY